MHQPKSTSSQGATTKSPENVFRWLCACIALTLSAVAASATSTTAHPAPKASNAQTAARSTSINDKSTLHRTHVIGNTLIEEGTAEGTLKGRVKIRLDLEPERASATSQFAIYLHGGELLGHASGKAAIGKEGWVSFGGEMWLDHGTGRYSHARGSGRMYGALDRRTDVLIVQVLGRAQGL